MRQARLTAPHLLALLFTSSFSVTLAHAQLSGEALETALARTVPHDRIVQPVDDNERVALPGNTLPQALPSYETGVLNGGRRLEHMVLVLTPDAAQQAALEGLSEAQQEPGSPYYHQWLTPESYAAHFGISSADIEQVQSWLERNGLQVDEITLNHRTIIFSGTVAQVESAFETSMRSYSFGGKIHIANASDPMIPTALAGVVGGVASLNDVFSTPQHSAVKVSPEYTASTSAHYLSPADYAVIYDIASLYSQAYTGSGESIAIVGRSDISLTDVRKFRSQFGLAAKDPVVIINGTDPGSAVSGDVDEAMLDVEWSGAVANAATINYVTSASTATSDGVFLSAQYAVNHNVAPVISVSYGLCESSLGASANSFWNTLWQQAATQGVTVLVSAGDSGAAGCDSSSATKATRGRGVNGICSTPYSTCVGGSEFNEGSSASRYWNSATSSLGLSVLSYIPETTWNESGSSGLWSTGGGVSTVYAKPSWQTGTGVPADGKRDVPDVSMTAAGHDAYLVQVSGALYAFSGTSAASPSFAGLMAILAQKTGARLGNANPELYSLAATGKSVFHDVVSGNNTVPGVTGFIATAGYDQATGLGSVDAENLLMNWGAPATPAFALALSSSSVTMTKAGVLTTLTTTISGGFKSAIALTASGLPTGCTATFTPATIVSPGTGKSTLKLSCSSTAVPGVSPLTVAASGGGVSKTATLSLSVPGLAVTATPASTSLTRSGTLAIALSTRPEDGFNSALTFSTSGLPAGVTAKFSPTSIAAPGSGTVTLTLTASKTVTLGVGKVLITLNGGGYSYPVTVPFTVLASATAVGVHRL